jgi:uncharacterized membrane protein
VKTQNITSPIDRVPFSAIARNWNRARIDGYFDNVKRHDTAVPSVVLNSLQTVDAKASGLLTYTSMMIAGLGLIAPLVVNDQIETGIIIKVGCYVLIALGCLRCLSIFQSWELFSRANSKREPVNRELILRRELYAWYNRMAIAVTIIVFVRLSFLYFWTPGK